MATYYPGVTDRNAATALEVTDGKQTTGLEIRIQQAKGYMVPPLSTPCSFRRDHADFGESEPGPGQPPRGSE